MHVLAARSTGGLRCVRPMEATAGQKTTLVLVGSAGNKRLAGPQWSLPVKYAHRAPEVSRFRHMDTPCAPVPCVA